MIAFGESFAEVQLAPKDAPPGMARGAARSEVASGTDVVPSLKQLRGAASGQATDVARALRGATAFSSADCVRRYVIFSDGIETRQAAAEEIAALRADGARVSTVSVSDGPPQDVAVLLVETPEGVRLGEPFEVRVTLRATSDSEGTLTLLQNGEENGLGGKRHLKLAAGEHTEVFQSVARVQGEATYQAQFAPDAGHVDALLDNNRVLSRIDVPGPPRVLLVDSEPGEAGHLARALSTQQFDVDVRSPLSFPRSKAELSEFRFVIVSDVAHKELGRGAESLLTFYVKAGGGLLFSGGSRGYGPGGYQGTELEKILPVRMDSEKERQIPGVAMVLVIDRSGSMTGLPLEMAKEACGATAGVVFTIAAYHRIISPLDPVPPVVAIHRVVSAR